MARKLNVNSQLGAKLDSIADVFFIGVLLLILITMRQWEIWLFVWVGIIILIRAVSLLIGFVRFGDLAFIHTYSNKFSGVLLFSLPFLLYAFDMKEMVILVCVFAMLSGIEELLINITSSYFSPDRPSLFRP